MANGMPTTLYPNAHPRLVRIFPMVCRPRSSAPRTSIRSLRSSTTCAASTAMPAPPPIAMPRSADARAAASLMPSPTMATCRPSSLKRWTVAPFSSGITPAMTVVMPTSSARCSAVAFWSPVSMMTCNPAPCMPAMASFEEGRS